MEKATIYEYARMRASLKNCKDCPLGVNNNGAKMSCGDFASKYPDKANEIILNWCKEHPVETRQDRFLKMFPNADIDYGFLDICPRTIDKYSANEKECLHKTCLGCKKEYWLAEVEENE
nr:MAG TPA: hypothetical protein [Caudoviricetes sp.]